MLDHHTSRDEYGPTRIPRRFELSASAQARTSYRPPLIVRVLRALGVKAPAR